MSYVFAALVVLNGLLFGYFVFLHEPQPTENLQREKAQLQQPIEFTNSSAEVPALIGTKK